MKNILNYLWIILLVIYIISPFDAHPLFFDDLIAAGILLYILYRNSRSKPHQDNYSYYRQSGSSHQSGHSSESRGPLTLDEAYRTLGVSPSADWDDISKAYREKMSKSHPDKVSHLSPELQEKAKELTLTINEAFDMIRRQRKG